MSKETTNFSDRKGIAKQSLYIFGLVAWPKMLRLFVIFNKCSNSLRGFKVSQSNVFDDVEKSKQLLSLRFNRMGRIIIFDLS